MIRYQTDMKFLIVVVFSLVAWVNADDYCPPRWDLTEGACYKQWTYIAAQQPNSTIICLAFNSTRVEIPANTTNEIFQKYQARILLPDQTSVVCRQDPSATPFPGPVRPVPTSEFDCYLPGFVGFNMTGSCYKVIRKGLDKVTIPQAKAECAGYGGYLAFAQDREEGMFIGNMSQLGNMALVNEQADIGGYNDNRCDAVNTCGHLVTDNLYYPHLDIDFDYNYGGIFFFDCQDQVTSFICEVDSPVMKKRYGPQEPQVCQAPAVQVGTECQCPSGYADIINYDLPDKVYYSQGEHCINNNPCASLSKKIEIMYIIDDVLSASDADHMVQFRNDLRNAIPANKLVDFKYLIYNNHNATVYGDETTTTVTHDYMWELMGPDGRRMPFALRVADGIMSQGVNHKKQIIILVTTGIPNDWSGPYYLPTNTETYDETKQLLKMHRTKGRSTFIMGIGNYLIGGRLQLSKFVKNPQNYFHYAQPITDIGTEHLNNLLQRVCSV